MHRRRLRAQRLARLVTGARHEQASLIRINYEIAGKTGQGWARERQPMPENFCLEENYEETAQCIQVLRERLDGSFKQEGSGERPPRRPFRVLPSYNDFTTIKRCSPSAALILAAEYDKTRALRRWHIPIIDPQRWKPELVALLDEIGFFRLLEIPRPPQLPPAKATRILPFQTGSGVAREEAAQITEALGELLLAGSPDLELDPTFEATLMQALGAVQEATENSCDHAYRNTDIPEVNKRWWATGAIDVDKRHLNLAVYDQGRSIPDTLPEWEKYPYIISGLARLQHRVGKVFGEDELDAIRMRLAMDVPVSSSGSSHRGKGFPLFKAVVKQSKMARLRILSRHGEFIYEKGARPQAKALKTPLNGTLVEWDLWL